MSFAANAQSALTALTPIVDHIAETGKNSMGDTTIEFSLKSNDDLKSVISVANEASTIVSVEPILPSMDEIFVRTVRNANNQPSSF